MHCPQCGATAASGQQFCRACGLNLEKIAEVLGAEFSAQSDLSVPERARLRERQKRFESLAGVAGLSTFGLILVLLFVLVFSQMIMKGGLLIIPGVLLILLGLGAGVMAAFQVYSKSLQAKLEQKPLPPSTAPLAMDTVDALRLKPNSVTEGTTELLAAANGAETGEINS